MSSQSQDEAIRSLTETPQPTWTCSHYDEPCSNRECLTNGCVAAVVRRQSAYNAGYADGYAAGFEDSDATRDLS